MASTGPDCGSALDAGDVPASATPLPVPLSQCAGSLSVTDVDWYSVMLTAGETLHLEVHRPPETLAANVCVYKASAPSTPVQCWADSFRIVLDVPIDETGAWLLRLKPNFSGGASYILTLSVNGQHETGVIQVGHFPLPVVRSLAAHDPARFDGFDGAWIDLAVVANGSQSLRVSHTGGPAAVDVAAFLYDASGALLAEQPCATSARGVDEWCTAPVGAARVLVEVSSGTDVPFALTYWH